MKPWLCPIRRHPHRYTGPIDDLLSEDMSAFWSWMIFVILNLGSELPRIMRVQFILSGIQAHRTDRVTHQRSPDEELGIDSKQMQTT